MNRRLFLTTVSAGISTSASLNSFAALSKSPYHDNIGIQVYTLRDQMNNAEAVFKSLAEYGYKQIEPYGYPGKADWIKIARDQGLAVHSSHFDWECVVNPQNKHKVSFDQILETSKEAGLSHLVVPYLHNHNRKTLDDYKRVAENCNKAAVKAKAAGIQLAYHNHAFEFEPKADGKCGFDIFVEEFAPEMKFEIDVFWVKVGNHDPVKLIEKLSSRVSQLHLKDLRNGVKLPQYNGVKKTDYEELGDGMIPMQPIIDAAAKVGVAHCHVEQDHSPDPLASVKKSIGHLNSL